MNVVVLSGRLLSDPAPRELPSGEVIWSLDLATAVEGEEATTLPVPVVWSRGAGAELVEGDRAHGERSRAPPVLPGGRQHPEPDRGRGDEGGRGHQAPRRSTEPSRRRSRPWVPRRWRDYARPSGSSDEEEALVAQTSAGTSPTSNGSAGSAPARRRHRRRLPDARRCVQARRVRARRP